MRLPRTPRSPQNVLFGAVAAVASLCVACGSEGSVTDPSGGSGGGVLTGAGGGATTSTAATSTSSASTGQGGSGGHEEKKGPPYPIVLDHGFFGFDDFAGSGFLTYFYGIRDHLTAEGEQVFTPTVDPFNSSTFRGEQLISEVEAILEQTGYAKVNLVGHSQGGLDARYVAHTRPDLVASVTTVATPHYGTPIADIALGVSSDPQYQEVLDWLIQVIGAPLYDEVGNQTSLYDSLVQLSQDGAASFNATITDAPGIPYWSIAGRTALIGGGGACQSQESVLFVDGFENELDPVDPLLSLTEGILAGSVFDPAANDGLVRVQDAKWGTFLGCVPADHLDEIGQLLGDSPGVGNGWDYVSFYDELVLFLRKKGL